MKLLGIITEITHEKVIELSNIPNGLIGLNSDISMKIGFSPGMSSDYLLNNFEIVKKKLRLSVISNDRKFVQKLMPEMGVWVQDEAMVFESSEGYFISDLIGCEVFNSDTGELIGKIKDVYILPANDVWIIETAEGELPFPAVDNFIDNVQLDTKKIYIQVIDGLMDLIQ